MVGIADFTEQAIMIDGRRVHVSSGGSGPPFLLLHGFPETHVAWRSVAPRLASSRSVVCPDLPGYGASDPPGGGDVEGYAKRRTAHTMVDLMAQLGHDRFAVIGHDRGGLVAFRAALDHPEAVTDLGALDVLPTVDSWAALVGADGVFAFHLFLLAQPDDLPERMIGADPDQFYGHFFDTWVRRPDAIGRDVRSEYLAACGRPGVTHAICQDYRASAFVDGAHDQADRDADRRLTQPVLAMWQDPGDASLPFDPQQIWERWAADLRTAVLPCGHFLPEERPEEVAAAIQDLIGASRARSPCRLSQGAGSVITALGGRRTAPPEWSRVEVHRCSPSSRPPPSSVPRVVPSRSRCMSRPVCPASP